MGGTFQAIARFQDSDLSDSNKNDVEMHFECDISLFRIQTLTQSHPVLCVYLFGYIWKINFIWLVSEILRNKISEKVAWYWMMLYCVHMV